MFYNSSNKETVGKILRTRDSCLATPLIDNIKSSGVT